MTPEQDSGSEIPLADVTEKVRQHHVWQYYLRSWENDGAIFCMMGNRIFCTGTRAVAAENRFYRIEKVTAFDIEVVKYLYIDIPNIRPGLRKLHQEFLELVTAPAKYEGQSAELDAYLNVFRTNAMENAHAEIERSFMPLLDSALAGDLSFYFDPEHRVTFSQYMAAQHMRTKGIREKTIDIGLRKNNIDLTRVWPIISHINTTNIGASIYNEPKRRLVLVENNTEQTFVTGDQPLVNLDGNGVTPPETLSWYYPISPTQALLLPEPDVDPVVTTETLTVDQVHQLNKKIVRSSHQQVFGNSREALDPYRPTP